MSSLSILVCRKGGTGCGDCVCTDSTPAWYTVDNGIFWLVQEKLTNLHDSCMGYIYVMSTPNTYTSDMKVVDSAETKQTGYTGFAWRRIACNKHMASGLI